MHNGSHSSIFSRSGTRGHSGSAASSAMHPSTEHEEKDHSEAPSITTPFPLFGAISLEIAQQIHNEFLICKICLDAFDKPKSLACLHTFCQKCIENHISAEVTYNKTADYHHFTCPLCRKRTNLPIGGVRKLPDNFFVSGLADMLSRTRHSSQFTELDDVARHEGELSEEDSVCGPLGSHYQRRIGHVEVSGYGKCEICGQFGDRLGRGRSSTPSTGRNTLGMDTTNQRANSAAISAVPKATSKCLDCGKLLCDQCVKRHREIRVTKDHAIFSLATESAIACKKHPDEPVRFYCEACSTCVCVLCTFNDHREHEMKSFGEAIQKLRAELRRKVNETQTLIQKTRHWLGIVDDAAEMVHKIERDVRECADRAIDEIHRQEDKLIEQLHSRVGRPTMQTIERAPEWECQLSRLESVHAEVVELLEGQDLNVLLHTRGDIKEKLGKLMQLEVAGALPSTACPKALFAPQPLCLGHLVFPDDPVQGKGKQLLPKLSPSIRIPVSTQTDSQMLPLDEVPRPMTKEIASEANVTPLVKQVRHRAINTEVTPSADQETNTRPRGVNVSITFGGDEQVDLVDSYLLAIKDIEESGQDVAFAAMDNLTRARLRRKLKERRSTVDTPEMSDATAVKATTPTNSAKTLHRRFSDNRNLWS
ncbi:E3 ubiquitin-protein ligase TRIM56 [Taenia crassiceps]|uniref:E3 ubiquitin-protein ligase TRIM56 n=1 Tax=Taenia crassiceps TaxID=6207 RepID=A0ABR4QSB0_9CEST